MTEAEALEKTLHDELGVTLSEDEGAEESEAEEEPEPEPEASVEEEREIVATDAAAKLARDEGIDLFDVIGNGEDGRILKSDVQAVVEVRAKLAAAEKEMVEIGEHAIPFTPDSFGRYESVYHYARTIHPLGGLGEEIKSPEEVINKIENELFANGWELAFVDPLGYGPDGLACLWIFGKLREGLEARHKEIKHIQRTLGANVTEGQITGFGADTYINSFLAEGWSIFNATALMRGGADVPMLWVLVR